MSPQSPHPPALRAGLRHEMTYRVPIERTVPKLLPEAPEFGPMPEVLATGYLVALVEWACMELLLPHIDWPRTQTVGTKIDLSHIAATPPGMEVRIAVELVEIDRRRLTFTVSARDEQEVIGAGTHERHLIDTARFSGRARSKAP